MRFITPQLDDPMRHPKTVRQAVAQQQQAVREAFREHNGRIRPLLPPPLQQLQEVYIHDARIRSLRIDATQRTVRICLTCCDSPGCFDLTLEYKDIQLTSQEISLLCFIAHHETAEVYWGEIDIDESTTPPMFIHRILWQTSIQIGHDRAQGLIYTLDPEIELHFGGFEMEVIPNPDGDYSHSNGFITVVHDLDKPDPVESGWIRNR